MRVTDEECAFDAKEEKQLIHRKRSPFVSLRLGHRSGLTVPRTVIQYLAAASLPLGGRLRQTVTIIQTGDS